MIHDAGSPRHLLPVRKATLLCSVRIINPASSEGGLPTFSQCPSRPVSLLLA